MFAFAKSVLLLRLEAMLLPPDFGRINTDVVCLVCSLVSIFGTKILSERDRDAPSMKSLQGRTL